MMRALSRMTLTPTMIKGGIKSNSVPETIELTCDVRTLPFQDEAYLRGELDKIIDGMPNVEYDIDYMAVPNSSEYESELTEAIKVAQAMAVSRRSLAMARPPSVAEAPKFIAKRYHASIGTRCAMAAVAPC